jgi:hypothetical protein
LRIFFGFWFNLFLRRFFSFEGCVLVLFYHNSFFNIEEYPDYLLLFALPQLLLVQMDGFCRLNVARPKLRRSKVYGNSIFRRGI